MDLFETIVNKVLLEYSNEPRLPFDGGKFGKKNESEQFLDWLEDFGKYGELPPSNMTFEEGVKSGYDVALKWFIDNGLICPFEEAHEDETPEEYYWNKFRNLLRSNGFLRGSATWKGPQFDDRGLMYVERAIKLPFEVNDESNQNIYSNLVKSYQNNIGGCWTWFKGGANAYCATAKGTTVIFKGYIRLEDIDWVETDYINGYDMNGEREIRVKPNAKIELFDVDTNFKIPKMNDTDEHMYKIPLRGHLIVSATYFGNNGKYDGDYAPIYDATSDDGKFMDRNGNIVTSEIIYKRMYKTAKEGALQGKDIAPGTRYYFKGLSFRKMSYNLILFGKINSNGDDFVGNLIRLDNLKIVLKKPCSYVATKTVRYWIPSDKGGKEIKEPKFFICNNYGNKGHVTADVVSEDGDVILEGCDYVLPAFGFFIPVMKKSYFYLIDGKTNKIFNSEPYGRFIDHSNFAVVTLDKKACNVLLPYGEYVFKDEWPYKFEKLENSGKFAFFFKNGKIEFFNPDEW